MSDPPRALKRAKKGEEEGAEADIFSRPSVLEYQNKALASLLRSEKSENERLKQMLSSLDNVNSALISSTSLAYHQLFALNDKLITLAHSRDINLGSEAGIRSRGDITRNFDLYVSSNSDKIIASVNETKTAITEAGTTLTSMLDSLLSAVAENGSASGAEAKLREELSKANLLNQKLQNQQMEHDSQINNLKEKIAELEAKAEEDLRKMKTLQLRADRNMPYIKFENKNFEVNIPPHECVCHVCGDEIKNDTSNSNSKPQNNDNMEVEEETKNGTAAPASGSINMSDPEAQVRGLKKINESLIEVITELRTQEHSQDQEIIKSRAFNRLLRNGHQLLQAHEELISAHQDLRKDRESLERAKEDALKELQKQQKDKFSEFQSQLQAIETQLKITEIEKENLQRELNRKSNLDVTNLEKSNDEYKQLLNSLETENKKLKDDLQRIIKEKSTISDRLNALRLEYDTYLNSAHKSGGQGSSAPVNSEDIVESQSKQIKDLIEELNSEKEQIKETYSEMEAIYQANQDLETKNKICNSKVEDANKRIEKSMEEGFKRARINENCKKEVTQIENELKIKDDIIEKMKEEKKVLTEVVHTEKQLNLTFKEREAIKDEIIKQLENELAESKKKQSDYKQQVEQADVVISKAHDELSDRLFKMSVNYIKTGKIQDPKTVRLDEGDIMNLDENGMLRFELQKYKQMVKCPT